MTKGMIHPVCAVCGRAVTDATQQNGSTSTCSRCGETGRPSSRSSGATGACLMLGFAGIACVGFVAVAGLLVYFTAFAEPTPPLELPAKHAVTAKNHENPPDNKKAVPAQTVAAPAAFAVDPTVDPGRVSEAIERGAAFLARTPLADVRIGAQALAGLTLLHCGRTTEDPTVTQLAARVRAEAPKLTQTYDLATCLFFLDRLDQSSDRELIRAIGLQLIAAQGPEGGWGYNAPLLGADKRTQLLTALAPVAAANAPPAQLAGLPVLRFRRGEPFAALGGAAEDNSNTQFAILALWLAQKHEVPAERSLAFVDARFRASQSNDGAWGYKVGGPSTYPDSMTCAGLLGLAVSRGAGAQHHGELTAGDPAIDKGLDYIGKRLSALRRHFKPESYGELYFLWTLERMAVAFDLQSIGRTDWYAWGAPIVLDRQEPGGGWIEAHGPVPDTCFALLFLKRANFARNLTVQLHQLPLGKHIVERVDPSLHRAGPTEDVMRHQGQPSTKRHVTVPAKKWDK